MTLYNSMNLEPKHVQVAKTSCTHCLHFIDCRLGLPSQGDVPGSRLMDSHSNVLAHIATAPSCGMFNVCGRMLEVQHSDAPLRLRFHVRPQPSHRTSAQRYARNSTSL